MSSESQILNIWWGEITRDHINRSQERVTPIFFIKNPIYKWIFPFHFGFCHFFPTQTRTKTVHVFPLFEIHRFYTKSDSKNKKHFFFTYFRFEQQMEKKKYMVKTFAHFGKSRELWKKISIISNIKYNIRQKIAISKSYAGWMLFFRL